MFESRAFWIVCAVAFVASRWVPKDAPLLTPHSLIPLRAAKHPSVDGHRVIANAIADAVGRRMDRLPMSPPRVLAALDERDQTEL